MNAFHIVFFLISCGCSWAELVHFVDRNSEELFITDHNTTGVVPNKLSPEEYIRGFGYPFEIHEVLTNDGYYLNLFRLPYGRNGNLRGRKKVVLLQHGLLSSAMDYLTLGPEDALGFIMADEGFDVWLGNFRGNDYSDKHVAYSADDDVEYWNFDYHESGIYDLPAMIDYILETTGNEKIYYVGHSLANPAFYVMCSERPEYNEKIHMQIALAPAVYLSYIHGSILLNVLDYVFNFLDPYIRHTDIYEWLSMNYNLKAFSTYVCFKLFNRAVCENIPYTFMGINENNLNAKQIADVTSFGLSRISYKIVLHFSQVLHTGVFKQYDHGWWRNLMKYSSFRPPKYDLSRVTVPVYIYYGPADFLIFPKDIKRLAEELPNVKIVEQVPEDTYSHSHFVWAPSKELVYSRFIRIMKNDGFENPPIKHIWVMDNIGTIFDTSTI